MSVRTLCGTYWGEAPVVLCVVQSLTVSRGAGVQARSTPRAAPLATAFARLHLALAWSRLASGDVRSHLSERTRVDLSRNWA